MRPHNPLQFSPPLLNSLFIRTYVFKLLNVNVGELLFAIDERAPFGIELRSLQLEFAFFSMGFDKFLNPTFHFCVGSAFQASRILEHTVDEFVNTPPSVPVASPGLNSSNVRIASFTRPQRGAPFCSFHAFVFPRDQLVRAFRSSFFR